MRKIVLVALALMTLFMSTSYALARTSPWGVMALIPGLSTPMDSSSAPPPEDFPPDPAYDFTAVGQDRAVALSWINPDNPDLDGCVILRRTDYFPTNPDDPDSVRIATTLPWVNTFRDTRVTNGTTYYYAIYAFDMGGNYSDEAQASATPKGYVAVRVGLTRNIVYYGGFTKLIAVSRLGRLGRPTDPPDRYARLRIEARRYGSTTWSPVAIVRTGWTGTASRWITGRYRSYYRAIRLATATRRQDVSNSVLLNVRLRPYLTSSRTRTAIRRTVRLYGGVLPASATRYRRAQLQLRTTRGWTTIRYITLGARGTFSTNVLSRRRVTRYYRLRMRGFGNWLDGYSGVRTIRWR